jgi:hypothetical protein
MPGRPYLKGHTVRTACQSGSHKLKNCAWLAVAEQASFELLLTTTSRCVHPGLDVLEDRRNRVPQSTQAPLTLPGMLSTAGRADHSRLFAMSCALSL